MDPMTMGFFISLQAAGSLLSWNDSKKRMDLMRQGNALDNAATQRNIEALALSAADESLNEMTALQRNLSTQLAVQAARGTGAGGSAASLASDSVRAASRDESKRRMNLLAKTTDLRAGKALSGLELLSSETKLGQAHNKSLFDMAVADFSLFALGDKK